MEPKYNIGDKVLVHNSTDPLEFEAIILDIQYLSDGDFNYLLQYLFDITPDYGYWPESCLELISL